MNKSIKIGIIVIISIVVISVACLVISNINKSNSETDYLDEEEQVQTETENKEALFWINSVNFAPKNENLNDNEFGISFPFKLEDLDNFNLYCDWKINSKIPADATVTEYVNSSEIVDIVDDLSVVHLYSKSEYKYDETLDKYINYNPFHLATFDIYNFSDSKLTVNECYKNGWWKIEQDFKLDIAFAMEDPDFQYSRDTYTKPLLDTIAKKMGKPTYILCAILEGTLEDMDRDMYRNHCIFEYRLIYEYDDFVIEVESYESYNSSYDMYLCGTVNLVYCPKEYWNQTKPTEQDYIKTIDKNGVTINFVESL